LPAQSEETASGDVGDVSTIHIAGGRGYYGDIAHRMAHVLNAGGGIRGKRFEPYDTNNTEGSVDNLLKLAGVESVQLAIAQSDVVAFAYRGLLPQPGNTTSEPAPPFHDMDILMSLQTEVLHIVMRRPFGLRDITDLERLDVCVEGMSSGSFVTAWDLLEVHGVPRWQSAPEPDEGIESRAEDLSLLPTELASNRNRRIPNVSLEECVPQTNPILDGGRDAWIEVTTPGEDQRIGRVLEERVGYLVPLDRSSTARMMDMLPLYVATEIEPREFEDGEQAGFLTRWLMRRVRPRASGEAAPLLPREIPSIGTRALLVESGIEEEAVREEIVERLWKGRRVIWGEVEIPPRPDAPPNPALVGDVGANTSKTSTPQSGLNRRMRAIGFHGAECAGARFLPRTPLQQEACWFLPDYDSGAINFLTRGSNIGLRLRYVEGIQPLVAVTILGTVLLLVLLVVSKRTREQAIRALNRHPIGFATATMLLLLTVATVVTQSVEQARNESFSQPLETIWSVFVFLFSGFEDRAPVTYWGRASSGFIMLLGPLIVAISTGLIVRIVQQQLNEGYVVPRIMRNHYLICHWNDRALGIILQLRNEVLDRSQETYPIVVLTESKTAPSVKEFQDRYRGYFRDVRVIIGSPANPRDLLRAKVHRARSIIVLARDDEEPAAADRTSMLVLAALRAVEGGWEEARKGLSLHWRNAGHLLGRLPEVLGRVGRLRTARDQNAHATMAEFGIGSEHWAAARRPLSPILVEAVSAEGERLADDGGRRIARSHPLQRFTRRDEFGDRLQVLRGDLIASRLIAAASIAGGGLVRTYFDLLSFTENSNEVYEVPVARLFSRDSWGGEARSFASVARELIANPPASWLGRPRPLLAIGVVREQSVRRGIKGLRRKVFVERDAVLNPSVANADTKNTVRYRDSLYVIAYEKPRRARRRRKNEV